MAQKYVNDLSGRKIDDSWGKVQPVPRGLTNDMTNTCYLNSVLQALSFTPAIYKHLLESTHYFTCEHSGFCVLCAMISHVRLLCNGDTDIIHPKNFINNIATISRHFRIPEQQDAMEFLSALMDKMTERDDELRRKFKLKICHTITCQNCGKQSHNTEDASFLVLSASHERGVKSSVQTGLNAYFAPDVLDYKCELCKASTTAVKSGSIENSSEVLIMQLGRFGPDGKNNEFISYPETLDISEHLDHHVNKDGVYDLKAVIIHNGASEYSGHYLVFVKTPDGKWVKINDTRITEVSLNTVLKQNGAYICFYQRNEDNVIGSIPAGSSHPSSPDKGPSSSESRHNNKRKHDADGPSTSNSSKKPRLDNKPMKRRATDDIDSCPNEKCVKLESCGEVVGHLGRTLNSGYRSRYAPFRQGYGGYHLISSQDGMKMFIMKC